jgi:hypothetical protein
LEWLTAHAAQFLAVSEAGLLAERRLRDWCDADAAKVEE